MPPSCPVWAPSLTSWATLPGERAQAVPAAGCQSGRWTAQRPARQPRQHRRPRSDAGGAAGRHRTRRPGEGILFIPQGRYRVTRTIYVWPGVRLIGYGEQRPVFVLADKTPGFQQGVGCMFFFTGMRPNRGAAGAAFPGRAFRLPPPPPGTVPPNPSIADAGAGTFYSAMSNI